MTAGKFILVLLVIQCCSSCEKEKNDAVLTCSQKNIEVAVLSFPSAGCNQNTGSFNVRATGSDHFTFSINSGIFQASGSFTNLKNGTYIITARDGDGCEQTKLAAIASGITPGPKFRALKSLLEVKCSRCHGGVSPAALKDWSVDCDIIEYKQLIVNRAVVIGDMPRGGPELTATEKSIITDWISAGGMIEN